MKQILIAILLCSSTSSFAAAPTCAQVLSMDRLELATYFAGQGLYTKAIDQLEQHIEVFPDHMASLLGLAKLNQKLGNQRAAIDHINRAIALAPQNVDLLKLKFEILAEHNYGESHEALEVLQEILIISPDDVLAQAVRSGFYDDVDILKLSQRVDSVPLLQRLYRAAFYRPPSVTPDLTALKILEHILAIEPFNFFALSRAGNEYWHSVYAKDLHAIDAEAYAPMAAVSAGNAARLAKYEEYSARIQNLLSQALRVPSKDESFLRQRIAYNTGQADYRRDNQAIVRDYQTLLALKPQSEIYLRDYASFLYEITFGRSQLREPIKSLTFLTEAIDVTEKALSENPHDRNLNLQLARLHLETNDGQAAALASVGIALESNYDDLDALELKEFIFWKSGDVKKRWEIRDAIWAIRSNGQYINNWWTVDPYDSSRRLR